MMKAAFLIWIIAAWTIERFTTQRRGSGASLLLHQLRNNGFNSLGRLQLHMIYLHPANVHISKLRNCIEFKHNIVMKMRV